MTACLFIGGVADGQHREVNDGMNFIDIPIVFKDPATTVKHQYRRRTIDTRNGHVDVFTHATPCPIEALIAGYNPP